MPHSTILLTCTSQTAPTAAVPPHITAAVTSPVDNLKLGGNTCTYQSYEV